MNSKNLAENAAHAIVHNIAKLRKESTVTIIYGPQQTLRGKNSQRMLRN